ncbi:MAG: membrane protein insertion efficiency factor YidD, partial [Burkholderiaceae bacterium]|nr:membrane protein insertion efficiency factor YidD [Burkholderiaceae bacterium]
MNRLLSYLVRAYQLILSPYVGGQCRYLPSCSDYACECLKKHSTCLAQWVKSPLLRNP